MCGFAGFIEARGHATAPLRPVVDRMADAIRHRGPDDSGAWADDDARVAFGFRRLAIIDVSEAGHQPFVSSDGRMVLVFNGEIYNHAELRARLAAEGTRHPWIGYSDTETLLVCFQTWGIGATLERAVGMFALALWDRQERRLFLARDRFGEKPLYYGWTAQAFVFGSELAALRRYPGFDNRVDRDVLALYLQYCCVPAPYAIYQNVYKLEPACVLSMAATDAAAPPARALFAPARHGRLAIERYWSLADVAAAAAANPIEDERVAIDHLEATLSDAVRLQSIADVPLGAFLSGGIDSSAIVALMQAQSTPKVRTFTIGFEETGFNEAEHAKAVARHLGTEHTELYVSAQQARDVIPRLPHIYSEPFADSSQVPTHLVAAMARRHVTVALSGDGGDELFGGYVRHQWGPRVWRQLRRVPAPLRERVGAAMQAVPAPAWDAIGSAVASRTGVGRLGDKAHKLAHRLRNVHDVDGLYRSLITTWPADAALARGAKPLRTQFDRQIGLALAEPEHRMMLWDALTYLPDDILHKVDRASMGVSLETRAPFLDHRVAELAWRLPLHMKIREGEGKWILRQLLYRHVPKDLIERPKMGFGIPLEAWLRGPLRDWVEHQISERRLHAEGFLAPAPIRQKWAEHLAGTRNWHNELWCVLMFQAWVEAN